MIFNVFKILHRFGFRSYGIVAHFSFHSSIISSAPARHDTFFQDFVEYGFMKHPSFLRGKETRNVVIYGELS